MLRRWTLSLTIVLFLFDFAMPLTPGAFRFDSEKTLEIAHRDGARTTVLGVQLLRAQRPVLQTDWIAREMSAHRVVRVQPAPLRGLLVRHAFRAEPEPASSEDH